MPPRGAVQHSSVAIGAPCVVQHPAIHCGSVDAGTGAGAGVETATAACKIKKIGLPNICAPPSATVVRKGIVDAIIISMQADIKSLSKFSP
jgi:hypothetical protein